MFKHNFFVYYTLLTDLHPLSLTQTRELKIKITFSQINNQNFVVSAGQLKFLTEMSRVGTKDLLRNYEKKLLAGKAGYNSCNKRTKRRLNRKLI